MAKMALQSSALLAGLRCRIWVEHIPSDDNPADVLSRAGLEDATVGTRVASGEWAYDPPEAETPFSQLDFESLWSWGAADH